MPRYKTSWNLQDYLGIRIYALERKESLTTAEQSQKKEYTTELVERSIPDIRRVARAMHYGLCRVLTSQGIKLISLRRVNVTVDDLVQDGEGLFLEDLPSYDPQKGSVYSFIINRLR